MTTYLPPLSIITDGAAREGRIARSARRTARGGDAKLALLAGVDSLAGLRRVDLTALGGAADLIQAPSGTLLGAGRELSHYWWMPLEGWMLVSGTGNQAITVPAGWSWTGDRDGTSSGRLTALRGGRILTAPIATLLGTLDEHPRLGAAIRATLVNPHV